MNLIRKSIAAKLIAMIILGSVAILAAQLFAYYESTQNINTYSQLIDEDIAHERQISLMLSEFKTQVQEWKNVLLRGYDNAKREKYWNKFILMCNFEHYPFEQPLHDIYKIEYCLSPIPSLALHCTNVNSIYGLSPNMDWKKIWDESGDF